MSVDKVFSKSINFCEELTDSRADLACRAVGYLARVIIIPLKKEKVTSWKLVTNIEERALLLLTNVKNDEKKVKLVKFFSEYFDGPTLWRMESILKKKGGAGEDSFPSKKIRKILCSL